MTEEGFPDTATINAFNQNIAEEFRANGGKVGGQFENGDLLLLTTTGAKSGQPRLSPLAYFRVEGKLIVIGSFAGAPKDPAWVHNLRANPQAHIEVGVLDEQLRGGLHVAVGERVALVDQFFELLENLLRPQFVLRVALDGDFAAVRANLHVEQRFDVLQVRVARAVDGLDAFFR
jgi:hypothetical protein